jgi:hypothetical protein
MIFWQIISVLNSYKKTKKNSKKRLLGPLSRSKLCENGPEIVEKKYTGAHSMPDVTPRKNKKVRSVRVLYAGSSGISDNLFKSLRSLTSNFGYLF